ncbi:EMB2076, partial [Symbiodinium sp. CCMP2592]
MVGKLVVMGQEAVQNAKQGMREDIYKKHISADKVPERLPYAIQTTFVELRSLKRFERNSLPRKGDRWELVLRLLGGMLWAAVMPNEFSLNAAVSSCAKGRWQRALALPKWLPELPVDRVGYNAQIRICEEVQRWKLSFSLLGKMRANGLVPDLIGFSAAMAACERTGKWELGIQSLASMHALRMQVDELCWSCAMSACDSSGHWQAVLALMAEARKKRCLGDAVAYGIAIRACCTGLLWQQALNMLCFADVDLTGDMICCGAAATACFDALVLGRSLELMESMHAQSRSLCKAGEDAKMKQPAKRLEEKRLQDEEQWKAQILKLLGEVKKVEQASASLSQEIGRTVSLKLPCKVHLDAGGQDVVRRYEEESGRRLELEERCLQLEEKVRAGKEKGRDAELQQKLKQCQQAKQTVEELAKQNEEQLAVMGPGSASHPNNGKAVKPPAELKRCTQKLFWDGLEHGHKYSLFSDLLEAVKDALQAFLGLPARGFPVPLLQRWKHHGPFGKVMASPVERTEDDGRLGHGSFEVFRWGFGWVPKIMGKAKNEPFHRYFYKMATTDDGLQSGPCPDKVVHVHATLNSDPSLAKAAKAKVMCAADGSCVNAEADGLLLKANFLSWNQAQKLCKNRAMALFANPVLCMTYGASDGRLPPGAIRRGGSVPVRKAGTGPVLPHPLAKQPRSSSPAAGQVQRTPPPFGAGIHRVANSDSRPNSGASRPSSSQRAESEADLGIDDTIPSESDDSSDEEESEPIIRQKRGAFLDPSSMTRPPPAGFGDINMIEEIEKQADEVKHARLEVKLREMVLEVVAPTVERAVRMQNHCDHLAKRIESQHSVLTMMAKDVTTAMEKLGLVGEFKKQLDDFWGSQKDLE